MPPLEIYWEDFLIHIARVTNFSMVIPVVAALIYRKKWNKPLRIIFIYCILTFVINLLEHGFIWATGAYTDSFQPFLKYWNIKNTFFLQILAYLKNFLVLSLFYSLIFPVKPFNHYILRSGQLLALAAIINYCFIVGYQVHGIFNPSANAIFIVILPLVYLWYSQRQSLRIPLKKNPYLWISLGLIIPNLFGLFLFFTGNYIYNIDIILYFKLYSAKNIFEIIGQILIAIGFAHSYYARFIKIA